LLDCWGAVPPGVTEGVVFVVSVVVVVVSPTTLPSLVCVVVVTVLFSLVPFWLSQPMVNTPNAEIRTNAREHFILIPFQKSQRCPLRQQETFLPDHQKIRALSVRVLPVLRSCLGRLSLPHASAIFHVCRTSAYSFSQMHSVRSHGECTP